ncbi:MAG: hypothetical protein ABL957_15845 [Parvularculaceae bacterium]
MGLTVANWVKCTIANRLRSPIWLNLDLARSIAPARVRGETISVIRFQQTYSLANESKVEFRVIGAPEEILAGKSDGMERPAGAVSGFSAT